MLDCLFQGTTEENPVSLDNLVRKGDIDCSTILLRTGLGGLDGMKPMGGVFTPKNFSGELRWKSHSSSPFGSSDTTGIFSAYPTRIWYLSIAFLLKMRRLLLSFIAQRS